MKTETETLDPFVRVNLSPLREKLRDVDISLATDDGIRKLRDSNQVKPGEEAARLEIRGLSELQGDLQQLENNGLSLFALLYVKLERQRFPVILHGPERLWKLAADDSLSIPAPKTGWPLRQPFSIHLQIVQACDLNGSDQPGLPYWKGALVAERRLQFNGKSYGPEFPFVFLTDEEFAAKGYPPGTTVVVEGFDSVALDSFEELESGPTDCCVLLNDRLKKGLRDPKGGRVLTAMIRAFVLAQILPIAVEAAKASGDASFAGDGTNGGQSEPSVAAVLCDRMEKRLGATWRRAVAEGKLPPERAFALAQKLASLTDSLQKEF